VRAGKYPAQDREDRTVGGSELGSLDLVTEHLELVAENGTLDTFGVLATEASELSPHSRVCEPYAHLRHHPPSDARFRPVT